MLTFRRRLFVAYYLGKARGNAAKAARLAGYANPKAQGSRLLSLPGIKGAIEAKLSEVAMSAEEVLGRLSDLARSDMGDFLKIGADGSVDLDLVKARRRDKLGTIKRLSRSRHGMTIELHDPIVALVMLAKYHGLFDPIDLSEASLEQLRQQVEGSN